MIYGYCRCSTDKQTIEHQKFEITEYATLNNLRINRWVEETISSRQPLRKRALGTLLGKLKGNDILIAGEISRLGRSLLEVMSILEKCLSRGCQVWTIKENYRLGNDIQSKVLAFAFGLAAEIERNLISQRTKASLANLKSNGKQLGRPLNEATKQARLESSLKMIQDNLNLGVPQVQIAKVLGINRVTLRQLILAYNLVNPFFKPRRVLTPQEKRKRRRKHNFWKMKPPVHDGEST